METNFTPGPWEVSPDNGNECGVITSKDYHFINVETTCLEDDDFFEMMANAKLIAAAPELMEACIEALKHHQGGHSAIGHQLRDAIKKATE